MGNKATKINVVNADEKLYGGKAFMFAFGSVGTRWVLSYALDIGEALEVAAEWLADRELWGHITPHDWGLDELGCDCADPFECDSHTYTESGWLSSGEWFLVGEDWNRDDIISFYRQLTRR